MPKMSIRMKHTVRPINSAFPVLHSEQLFPH